MNVSKSLISTVVAVSIAGAVGLAYAQSNQNNINVKPNSNLTQTQSDAALPCQPTPFNPHLPADAGSRGNTTSNNSTDCATPVATTMVPVRTEYQAPMPVVVQTDATMPNQPAPFSGNTSVRTTSEPTPVYTAPMNDTSTMSSERMPREDRN